MGKKHILIADDDDATCASLTKLLEFEGYYVSLARNGWGAYKMIYGLKDEVKPIDLLVTDFQMPGLDGLHLMEALQKDNLLLPVVVMTGYGFNGVIEKMMEIGKVDYMEKPFEVRQLTNRIELLLNGKELETLASKPERE